jgi:hypothetical protein
LALLLTRRDSSLTAREPAIFPIRKWTSSKRKKKGKGGKVIARNEEAEAEIEERRMEEKEIRENILATLDRNAPDSL